MSKEEAKNRFWSILKQSKLNKPYCKPVEQYLSLLDIISKEQDEELLEEVEKYGQSLVKLLKKQKWFDKLHQSRGGFVDGGDDKFYMDFPAWVIAQGEELFQEMQASGMSAITNFIKTHNISPKDVVFENLLYPFSKGMDGYLRSTERKVCYGVIRSESVPNVQELVVASTGELVGYKLTYPLTFLYKGVVLSGYQVDIPLDALGSTISKELSAKSTGQVPLIPHGEELVSEDEYKKGYTVPNAETLDCTDTLTSYLRYVNLITGYID